MQNELRIAVLTGLVALGAACSNTGASYEPVLDGTRNAVYLDDLSACQALARSQAVLDAEAGNAALAGAALGAVLGAVDDESDAAEGAVAGALGGLLAETVQTPDERKSIVIACLRQRGHRVVG